MNQMVEALIKVRVVPRASRDEVMGWQEDELRIRLKAPPVEGRANSALCRLLAARLGLPASAIEVVSGATSRTKLLRVSGLSREALRQLLA
jgi:uncharacterized protein (TIGR00251 family)